MDSIKALFLALIVGVFFIIGMAITKFVPKKKELALFATGLSFAVMLGMILFDIIPEIGETLVNYSNGTKWLIIILCTGLGIGLLKGLDLLIPHHHHDHKEKEKNHKEHNEHLFHIGFITTISLILHNIVEGMSIYVTGLTNFKAGLMMALAVSLHNIPLGMEIAVGMSSSKKSPKIKLISLISLISSSLIGALILFIFQTELNGILLACLLCLTFGMLIYIALFELLKEIWFYRKSLPIYVGIVLGILFNIVMVMV